MVCYDRNLLRSVMGKRNGNNCTRMVFYYNPNKDKPLLNKLQEEWLNKN